MDINELKKEYNYWLERNRKAEKFFKENEPDVCLKWIKNFNEIVIKLSQLKKRIEMYNGKMTNYEILNGFKGVK